MTADQADEAIEHVADDLLTQISWYEEHGVSMRGGFAPAFAAQAGAGKRLEEEIVELAGISVEDFRALSERERDAIFEAAIEFHSIVGLRCLAYRDGSASELAVGGRARERGDPGRRCGAQEVPAAISS